MTPVLAFFYIPPWKVNKSTQYENNYYPATIYVKKNKLYKTSVKSVTLFY
jgi:hypothetical protein